MKKLGKGSFGKVYLVKKKQTGDLFAMKTLSKKVNDHRRIWAEANILRSLDSPNVVKLYYTFDNHSEVCLVEEFLPGRSAEWYLQKLGQLDENKVRYLVKDLVSALDHLSEKDVIHRDIKPDNLLLGLDGRFKLVDFGLSCSPTTPAVNTRNPLPKNETFSHSKLRRSDVGSPAYSAPEVHRKLGHEKTSDLWSVGVLTYELLTGELPFDGEEVEDIFAVVWEYIQGKRVLEWPEDLEISEEAKDFVSSLLKFPASERPALTELKNHPFLSTSFMSESPFAAPLKAFQKEAEDLDAEWSTNSLTGHHGTGLQMGSDGSLAHKNHTQSREEEKLSPRGQHHHFHLNTEKEHPKQRVRAARGKSPPSSPPQERKKHLCHSDTELLSQTLTEDSGVHSNLSNCKGENCSCFEHFSWSSFIHLRALHLQKEEQLVALTTA
eukprot:TRINITY_DN605_c0_g1_i4.p1 TRINITY_DN605_c0_g1~~TRINITY_DN605_c0_g1_i4.p1  ORF type:complete len:474 (-),score=109.43 TRINITY_DN605_c0_g1_i4:2203-3510(-)